METIALAPPLPESPYPGIKSFRFLDQQIFVSREEDTWNLLSNVLIYRGVLLYGDSGSGKSSLVNAGLIPAALKENFIAHRLRVQPQLGKEIKVERIPIETEDKPPYLPSVFVTENSDDDKHLNLEISIAEFQARLLKLKELAPGKPRPILIFDQFEEFITLFEEALRSGSEADIEKPPIASQQAILQIIGSFIEDETVPVKILFVFREDYLAKLDPLFKACPQLLNQYLRLLPPRVEEAEQIIRAPFVDEELRKKFLKGFLNRNRQEISPELAQAVAQQLQERSDTRFINLSELQIVCWKLWESVDPGKYFEEKDRDIQKVLEDYWSDVLKKLGDLYEPAVALLGHMVTASNTRNIISEPDLKAREIELDPKQIDAALKALVARKLVRREPRNKIYFYEIASEFLVPWIEQKRAARLAELRARELAAEARNKLRESEQEKRYLRIGGAVLALLLLVAVGAAIVAFYQRRVAKKALATSITIQQALENQKNWSGNIIRLLNEITSHDANVRLNAVNGLIAMDWQGQLPRDLVPVILAVSSNDDNADVSKAASYFFYLAARQTNSDVTVSILKYAETNTALADARNLAPRVYIQLASDQQRGRADNIAAELKKNGFTVPGFELVDSRHAPKTNQLRYYKSADENSTEDPSIDKVLELLNTTDRQRWSKVALPATAKVGAGHFELWFARDSLESDGTLSLRFEDEQGNQIYPATFKVSLTSSRKAILRSKNSSLVDAPAGRYSLVVQVPGYQIYRDDIQITAAQDTTETVPLRAR